MVGVAIVHDYVGGCCCCGDGVEAVVVALDDGDVGVGGGEGWGCFAEEYGDGVFWVRGVEGVQDGAAYVACAACAEGG